MARTLHMHPLASYCQKVLVAMYEHDVAFTPHLVDLGDAEARAAFLRLSPLGKMPVLEDGDRVVTESTIVIEYVDLHMRGTAPLIPDDRDAALDVRFHDRYFDLYVHEQMQRIVGDRLRAPEHRDAYGVQQARAALRAAYAFLDAHLQARTWCCGETFGLADCAAAPALFYANEVEPFAAHPHLVAYFDRLSRRPSVVRVRSEAEPYMRMFPR